MSSSVIDLQCSFWMPERTAAAIKMDDHTHLIPPNKADFRSMLSTHRVAEPGATMRRSHRWEQPRSEGLRTARGRPVYGLAGLFRVFQISRRPTASGPLRPWATSMATRCPSAKPMIPERSNTEACTKISFPP
jgi:hypothetical protein